MNGEKTCLKFSFPDQGWLLLIPLVGMIMMWLPELARESLYLNLASVQQGEIWRLFTAHFVYVSWQHWLVNTIGIALLLLFFGRSGQTAVWLSGCCIILAAVSAGLLVFSESLLWYAGFSGVLAGLFVLGAIMEFSSNRVFCSGILIIITAYIAIQLQSGELLRNSFLAFNASAYAHACGYVSGLIYGVANRLCIRE